MLMVRILIPVPMCYAYIYLYKLIFIYLTYKSMLITFGRGNPLAELAFRVLGAMSPEGDAKVPDTPTVTGTPTVVGMPTGFTSRFSLDS